MGEPSLAGFGGVVCQGEAKAGKSGRRGGAMGHTRGEAGPRLLVFQNERPGVERSAICVWGSKSFLVTQEFRQVRRDAVEREWLPRIFVRGDAAKPKASGMAPGIEHHSLRKRLPVRGHDNGVVLVRRVHVRHCQMKFEGLQAKFVELREKVVRPVVTQAAITQAAIDKKIVEPGWPHGAILMSQGCRLFHRNFSQPRGLIGVYSAVELQQPVPEGGTLNLHPMRVHRTAGAAHREEKADEHCRQECAA